MCTPTSSLFVSPSPPSLSQAYTQVRAKHCPLHSLCLALRAPATVPASPAPHCCCQGCHSRYLQTTSLSPAAFFFPICLVFHLHWQMQKLCCPRPWGLPQLAIFMPYSENSLPLTQFPWLQNSTTACMHHNTVSIKANKPAGCSGSTQIMMGYLPHTCDFCSFPKKIYPLACNHVIPFNYLTNSKTKENTGGLWSLFTPD